MSIFSRLRRRGEDGNSAESPPNAQPSAPAPKSPPSTSAAPPARATEPAKPPVNGAEPPRPAPPPREQPREQPVKVTAPVAPPRGNVQSPVAGAIGTQGAIPSAPIPPSPARTGWAFLEVARRHGDYAQIGVAALVTLDESGRCREARLVYLSAGDRPMEAREAARLLAGQEISPAAITAAAEKASRDEIDPAGDVHASAEFKRHLARVLTGRVVRKAVERASA